MEPLVSHRLVFEDLPPWVCGALEAELGAAVVDAVNRRGGYSPSLAARCSLSDGRVVFVKAVSPQQNPESPDFLRREASVTAVLPDGVPAPRILHVLDDGHWIVTVYEYIDGELPSLPWSPTDLGAVIQATLALAEHPAPSGLPSVAERYGGLLTGWRTLAGEPGLDGIDPWARRHLEALAEIESGWEEAVAGDELVHGDVRSDNVLIGPGGITFVDWSSACVGRTFFDVVAMLPSVALEGGGEPDEVLERHGAGHVDPEALTALVTAHSGYFMERSRLPDPPGLPTVRAFQRAQGEVALRWLRRRLGWR